ncbi:MAG: tRNA epoxyqueuosine(34) reductase QueG [Verrucomicrobia bacterium]|nr:tRNA epoxyqueuosine(34) reductase QueG [Verrucomicrobiota bacterium]MDE3099237.1 tRNA epoxyqueuosine(34) reductase QueG [Verrucomicrobiota bacterium]
MKQTIRERALASGFDDCRFTSAHPPQTAGQFQDWLGGKRHGEMEWLQRSAQKRLRPENVLSQAATVIVLAASYAARETASRPAERPAGVVARYARFNDYHHVLAGRLKSLADDVNSLGGPGTRSLWYVDTGPLLERDLAQRAGLGFIGKHTNLISRKSGNWIFLAEIITTLRLEPDPPETNHCGKCARCIAACPTNAITAPFQLDARRCISYLTIELKGAIPVELRAAIGDRVYGCDDCLAVCPWNRFAHEGRLMTRHRRPEFSQLDLLELLALDEAAFKARFAGSPILRAKRRGLLRNVCVALGNVGNAEALPALEKAARDADPLVAGHALWAIEQIQTRPRGPDLSANPSF